MLPATYPLNADTSYTVFRFVSEGPKGKIDKLIQFAPMKEKGVYNLGFGDIDPRDGSVSDTTVSDNGDMKKIFATVALAVQEFIDHNKDKIEYVFAKGNTNLKTNLYNRLLGQNIAQLEEDYQVYGRLDKKWVKYQKGSNYDAFRIKPKKH